MSDEELTYNQKYYRENKEKFLLYNRIYLKNYYSENKERFQTYYQQNKHQRLEYQKAYHSKSKDQIKEYQRKYWIKRKKKMAVEKIRNQPPTVPSSIKISNKPTVVTFD